MTDLPRCIRRCGVAVAATFVLATSAHAATLVYAGYVGGSNADDGRAIAVDVDGNVYLAGTTSSTQTTFPVLVGPDLTWNSADDVFVAKINATGSALLYAGYIGGMNADFARGIAVDASGNAYVTGVTGSGASFPTVGGPDLSANGFADAFVSKINASGTALVYSGFIGGNQSDTANAIAVDSAGNAYVTGQTQSTQATFPVLGGPDGTANGLDDAFVAKVNPSGTLLYSGFIGGGGTGGLGTDVGTGIAVDSAGNAYVCGWTDSRETSFPVTIGPDLSYNGGDFDAFVVKVNAAGTALDYAGYIGGAVRDEAFAIAVDASGSAYVTGRTTSTQTSFPVLVGPDLTFNSAMAHLFDAFVTKVNSAGTALVYSGYIGGSVGEDAYGIDVDSGGNAYVTGYTTSTSDFPAVVGPDLTFNGNLDAFVTKVAANGATFVYSSYFGGFQSEEGRAIAVDGSGSAYVTGYTISPPATFPALVGPDLTFNGIQDAFVAKITDPLDPIFRNGFQ